MVLPAGVTTCLVYKKAPVSFGGSAGGVEIEITPSVRLTHIESGVDLVDFIESIVPNEGGVAQVMLPHTDQAGFRDQAGNAFTNWHYTARVRLKKAGQQPKHLPLFDFQIPTGQTEVDLSSIPHGVAALPLSAPVAAVTSVSGLTGAVTEEQLAAKRALAKRDANNILDFGVIRGTAASQTVAIKSALDSKPGESFYFPPGDYRLDTPLVITSGAALILDPSARLYAGAAMETLVDYKATDGAFESLIRDKGLTGGLLDGNLLANTVLSIQNVLRFTLTQFTIRDGINRGIKAGPSGAEIIARDGRIYNTGITNVVDNTAIESTMGDCYWSDIIVLDWTNGVKDTASSTYTNVHTWLGQSVDQLTSRYPTSKAFEVLSQADLISCYADTYRTAYKLTSNGTGYTPPARLINCIAYWAPTNLSAALAAANPAYLIDNTDGVGGKVVTMRTGGHPEVPALFLKDGVADKLNIDGTVNQGFTTGVAEYINGVKQGEAAFTPTISATTTAGSHNYAAQTGRMVVDGNTVTYFLNVTATLDATIAGALRIGNLPLPTGVTGVRLATGSVGYVSGANIAGVFTGGSTTPGFDLTPVSRGATGSAEIWANDLQGTVVEVWATLTTNWYKN